MTYRILAAAILAVSLGGCGGGSASETFQREVLINVSPSDAYEVTNAILTAVEGHTTDEGFNLEAKPDGLSTISVSYMRGGHAVFEQTFHMESGSAGQTKLSMTAKPSEGASAEERVEFARSRDKLDHDFDAYAKLLDRMPRAAMMADIARFKGGPPGQELTFFYDGPTRHDIESDAGRALPRPRDPMPDASASAPGMTAQPMLDPTVPAPR